MNKYKFPGWRLTIYAILAALTGPGVAYHADAAPAPAKTVINDPCRIGSSVPLPPRDATSAGFWRMLDYWRLLSEVKSFDLARMHSYPHYDLQARQIISCMQLIANGKSKEAGQLLEKLKNDQTYLPYAKILDRIDRNLHPENNRELRELAARRKFVFLQPRSTLELQESKHLVVEVIIDGTAVPMVIDTGSPASSLSQKTIDKLKIKLKSAPAKKPENIIQYADKVELGKLVITGQPFTVNSGKFDVIGWDILRHINLVINRNDAELIISEPKPETEPGICNLIDFGDRALARIDLADNKDYIYFVLDTGSDETFLQNPLIDRISPPPEKLPMKHRERNTFYGHQSDNVNIYPDLNAYVCGIPVKWNNRPIYPDVASHGMAYYGFLGLDMTDAKYGVMEIDATNGRFHLSGPDIDYSFYNDYKYPALLNDDVNPMVRYSAGVGIGIMAFPALTNAILAMPLGRPAMFRTLEYTFYCGEITTGGLPWLLTNWFYTSSYPAMRTRQYYDRFYVDMCKLNNYQQFPTAEQEALLRPGNDRIKSYVLLAAGKYEDAIDCMANDDGQSIYAIIAELKRGDIQTAVKRSKKLIDDKNQYMNRFIGTYAQLLAGQIKEEQMLAALKESRREYLAGNYYMTAEYFLNVKKDPAEALKYYQKTLDYPFNFPAFYLSKKMIDSLTPQSDLK